MRVRSHRELLVLRAYRRLSAGYRRVSVTGRHNTFENCTCHDIRNTGLEINEGGAYTAVINCDARPNCDPEKLGGMAAIALRAWEKSDDGFDASPSPSP
jgi:hypothetical protein